MLLFVIIFIFIIIIVLYGRGALRVFTPWTNPNRKTNAFKQLRVCFCFFPVAAVTRYISVTNYSLRIIMAIVALLLLCSSLTETLWINLLINDKESDLYQVDGLFFNILIPAPFLIINEEAVGFKCERVKLKMRVILRKKKIKHGGGDFRSSDLGADWS